jgi:poly(ADP-ribose) glycohydrolase ARH3
LPTLADRFAGSLLGLALGDALGAKHEGGPIEQVAWWLAGLGRGGLLRWTDDTQMAIGLAESLVRWKGVESDPLARTWAEAYDPLRGYGPGARRLLSMIRAGADWRTANRSVFADGSLGNGAAMRAAPLGLFYHAMPGELRPAAELAASITHAHPLGIAGGVLIARAVALAVAGGTPAEVIDALLADHWPDEFRTRLETARSWLGSSVPKSRVAGELGCGIEAHRSAVTAVWAWAAHPDDFEAMIAYVISLGGDTDTIGAMAGGVLGARLGIGGLPAAALERLESREHIHDLARRLEAASPRAE